MKKIILSLTILTALVSFADIKKPLNIDDFAKEIEKIQNATKVKDDSVEITKEIQKLQQKETLVDLQSRKLKANAVKLEVTMSLLNLKAKASDLKMKISKDSFIFSNKGFKIGKVQYKRVAFEDVYSANEKIIKNKEFLSEINEAISFLKKLEKEDVKYFYNSEIASLVTSFKNKYSSDTIDSGIVAEIQGVTESKNYTDVKAGDSIAGTTIKYVSKHGIKLRY